MTTGKNDNRADISSAGSILDRIKKSIYEADYFLLMVLFVFASLGYLLVPYYQYKLSPDGISYIRIAQKYFDGDFWEAVNGYWSPLFSWLLAPFLVWSTSQLIAVKLCCLVIGLITILGIRALASRFTLSKRSMNGLTIGLIPFMLHAALVVNSPDFLILCFVAFYLAVIFNMDYCRDHSKGRICGALGGLAYLSKVYAFPFFIIHFFVFNGIHYYCSQTATEKHVVLKNLTSGLIIFLLISGSWIFVISSKYGHFTIGSSINYNVSLMAGGSDLPEYTFKLAKPANNSATNIWEDPSQAPVSAWNPLSSASAFQFYAKRVRANLRNLYFLTRTYSEFLISIVLFTVLSCLQFFKNRKANPLLFCLVTVIIYSSGYILIWVQSRYMWIALILFTIAGYYFIDLIYKKGFLSKRLTIALVCLFCLSCILPSLRNLTKFSKMGQENYEWSRRIDSNYGITGNIASDYYWKEMLYLSFHNNYTYFGITSSHLADDELQRTLREHDVDYYFVWRDSLSLYNAGFLSTQKEITGGEIKGLRIYHIKETGLQ